MSSSSGSKNVFAKMGIPHATHQQCSHGCPIPAGQASASYPYNATARLIVEQLVDDIEKRGGSYDPKEEAIRTALTHLCALKLDANQKERLIKTFIMIGTDAADISSGQDYYMGLAKELAQITAHMEEEGLLWDKQTNKKDKEMAARKVGKKILNLDSDRGIVRFFDSRIACSCLDEAKDYHKVQTGFCRNPACEKCSLDAKLLLCGGCKSMKYCSKECQSADWGDHKKLCKKLQKKKQDGSKSKCG